MENLFESFGKALPNKSPQIIEPTQSQLNAHISGSNTNRCFPPDSGFEIPVQHWLDKAEDLCLRIPQHKASLERSGLMPRSEEAQLIYSEQDVVSASTLHFTHPVNIALRLVHSNDYYRSEVTKGKSKVTPGALSSSDGTSSRSRVDTLYFKGFPRLEDSSNPSNPFACLEYKRFKALNAGGFASWIVRTKEAHQGRREGRREDDDSYEKAIKNASIILSQATHYSLKFQTPFVALFDWNTLILLVMTKTHHDEKGGQGGEFAYMTIITDSRLYRKAFLGFLLCAHQHAERDASWQTGRDRTNILTKAATLGDMTGGAGRSTTRSGRAAKSTYREPGSGSDFESSQGSEMQLDNMRRAAQSAHASAQSANGRKPSGHAQTISGKVQAAPPVAAPTHRVSNTASLPVRQKPEASKSDARHAVAKPDVKHAVPKPDAKKAVPKPEARTAASKMQPTVAARG